MSFFIAFISFSASHVLGIHDANQWLLEKLIVWLRARQIKSRDNIAWCHASFVATDFKTTSSRMRVSCADESTVNSCSFQTVERQRDFSAWIRLVAITLLWMLLTMVSDVHTKSKVRIVGTDP
jgi:hypothetical protein